MSTVSVASFSRHPRRRRSLFALRHFRRQRVVLAELTGNWEFKLKQMEHGLCRAAIHWITSSISPGKWSPASNAGTFPDTVFLTLKTPCPKCGGTVQENYRKFKCQKCDFSIWKVVSSREFAPEEIETLITKRSVAL